MNAPHAKQPAVPLKPSRSTARPISAFSLQPPSLHHPRAPTRDFHPPETHARIRRHPHRDTRKRKEKEKKSERRHPSIHLKSKEQDGSKGRRFRKYATHHVQVCPVPLPFPRCIMARVEWRVTDTYGVVHVSVT